jgi:hypothetical protein
MSQQIIHNTGTNYTLYYNVINYFKTIMSNHPSILAVTLGDIAEFDDKQFPTYPIGNIQILESDFGTSVTNFRCQLMIADKVKNKDNESNPTTNEQTIPYYQVNDKVDIYANTLAILNDLTSYTQRGVQNFEINEDIICTPFADRFDNGLAGWTAEFTLTTHNDKNRCLFFLIDPNFLGYRINDCITGTPYNAIISVESGQDIGGAFATKINTSLPADYGNLKCFSVGEGLEQANWQFVNIPMVNWPQSNLINCDICELWIEPKIWNTTPATWTGAYGDFRTWITD